MFYDIEEQRERSYFKATCAPLVRQEINRAAALISIAECLRRRRSNLVKNPSVAETG